MANIYYLNHQPSFWDNLISRMEDHPFFAAHARRGQPHPFWGWPGPGNPNAWGWDAQAQDGDTSNPEAQAAGQDTEPTAGPSTPTNKPDAEKEGPSPEPETNNDQCPRGNGRRHPGPRLDKERKERKCKGRHGSCHYPEGCRRHPGPSPSSHPFAPPFGGHPCGRGPHRRGRHDAVPPAEGPGFEFLKNLAAQFGVPVDAPKQEGVDFVPSVDVFDTSAKYIVHVSLPGARKEDMSIDWDPAESVLRLAGVVYRPGVNEDLHQALVMEERAREVGVFEREIRLGTRESPAVVSVDEITAQLVDGVLSVVLPKIVEEPQPKKKVVVEDGHAWENEKEAMQVDESPSGTMTPEGSDGEEETPDYVKVPVQ